MKALELVEKIAYYDTVEVVEIHHLIKKPTEKVLYFRATRNKEETFIKGWEEREVQTITAIDRSLIRIEICHSCESGTPLRF